MDNGTYGDPHGVGSEWTTSGPTDQVNDWDRIYHEFKPVFSWTAIGIGVFGIVGNILVLRVYAKMGVSSSTIHTSFVALSVADLCCILSVAFCGISTLDAVLLQFDAPASSYLRQLAGALLPLGFSKTSALITAWISLERCLGVAFPTKMKLMVTRTVSSVVLATIFIAGCAPMVFVYVVTMTAGRFDGRSNSTTLFVYDGDSWLHKGRATVLSLYGLAYPVSSWVTVTVCSIVLVIKLTHSRRRVVPGSVVRSTGTQAMKTMRERRVTKLIVMVAGVFLLCSAPVSAHIMSSFTIPGYFRDGSLKQLYLMNEMICMIVTELNSSLNILIFAFSGQKFRAVLLDIFSGRCCGYR